MLKLTIYQFCLPFFLLCSICFATQETTYTLKNDVWSICIASKSLEVIAQPNRQQPIQIAVPQENLEEIANVKQVEDAVSLDFPKRGVTVSFQLIDRSLFVSFISNNTGNFTWPIIGHNPTIRGYILPLFEGSYIPADDLEWQNFLVEHSPMNTTEGLSMPFWGLDWGDYTLTYILTNPFNNELAFEKTDDGLNMKLTHQFTRNWKKKEYGLIIRLGNASPIEPAKQYRQWLIDQGEFVSMKEKIRSVPDAEKLLGADQIYLWGGEAISQYDIRNWKDFALKLKAQADAVEPSPGKRIWEKMNLDGQNAVTDILTVDYPDDYTKRLVADALSELLADKGFYEESAWAGFTLSEEIKSLVNRRNELTVSEVCRLNSLLLDTAFPGFFIEPERWGDGVSVKMIERFAENGFDRLWLGLNSWTDGFRHPQVIAKAKESGYLIGPYDSYHSIHSPDEPDTWETAQFDLNLYETGAIVKADGTKITGFNRKGYNLSPIAARPYVEKRVNSIMSVIPFNSWFIDCDAYGEVFDDYSELHPATQLDDVNARMSRIAWIRDSYKTVVGSEVGVAYSASTIHFAHGMMTPVIGWGDLNDKSSPYYLGGYWPPDGPDIFVKQVQLKPQYFHFYFDPKFRVPLYQTVFHDSVVTTHHWGCASLKFKDQVDTVALLELLYNVPPLYHINLKEFEKHKRLMKAHYDFFSPLHRVTGLLPMTDFTWLTSDRLVQRTVFGDIVEMIANFSTVDFKYQGIVVPKRSILAKWNKTGKTEIFTPNLQYGI